MAAKLQKYREKRKIKVNICKKNKNCLLRLEKKYKFVAR